ncbi:kinase-like domain-containing protein [Dichotomocladium elegans]|nr:kinase-like domain-containing protein [Dichotomocladium elegans]
MHTCNLLIKHKTISPVHATIYTIEHGEMNRRIAYIRDVSDNGTFINNRPIDKGRSAILFPGCVVSFALQAFSFYFIPAAEPDYQVGSSINIEHLQIENRRITLIKSALEAGAQGSVYFAIPNDESGYQMACKVRDVTSTMAIMGGEKWLRHELHMLKQLHHPNVIKLLHHHKSSNGSYYFFMPLAGSGTLQAELRHYCNQSVPMPLRRVKNIFLQLAKAVHYLHNFKAIDDGGKTYKRPIIHRDIKPANILLHTRSLYPRVVLTDFGSAVYEDEIATAPSAGTPFYTAPETRYDDRSLSGAPADIWSLGLVLYEMISGMCPSESDAHTVVRDFDDPVWKTKETRGAVNLVRGMLSEHPSARPTTTELLSSGWIYSGAHNLERGRMFKKQFENEVAVWEGREKKMYPMIGSERAKVEACVKDPKRLIRISSNSAVNYSTIKKITGYRVNPGLFEDGVAMIATNERPQQKEHGVGDTGCRQELNSVHRMNDSKPMRIAT